MSCAGYCLVMSAIWTYVHISQVCTATRYGACMITLYTAFLVVWRWMAQKSITTWQTETVYVMKSRKCQIWALRPYISLCDSSHRRVTYTGHVLKSGIHYRAREGAERGRGRGRAWFPNIPTFVVTGRCVTVSSFLKHLDKQTINKRCTNLN